MAASTLLLRNKAFYCLCPREAFGYRFRLWLSVIAFRYCFPFFRSNSQSFRLLSLLEDSNGSCGGNCRNECDCNTGRLVVVFIIARLFRIAVYACSCFCGSCAVRFGFIGFGYVRTAPRAYPIASKLVFAPRSISSRPLVTSAKAERLCRLKYH